MAIDTDKDKRFKGLEIKIGALVAVAVVGIIVIIVFIGIQKDLFTHKYQIFFTSASGAGFKVGMPVQLSGFNIGRVKKIDLTEAANVKVVLELNKKYEKWVRSNSVAGLGKEGFIGDAYIEIALGGEGGRVLEDGDEIPYVKSGGIEALVEGAKPILSEVADIIHYVNDPDGDLKASISNIKDFTAELRQTRRELDKAIGSINRLVVNLDERATPGMDSFAKTGRNLQAVSEGLVPVAGRVDGILSKADAAMDNVNKLTGALAGQTPRISGIVADVSTTASESKGLVKGIRQGWIGSLTAPAPAARPELVPLDASYPPGVSRPDEKPEAVK